MNTYLQNVKDQDPNRQFCDKSSILIWIASFSLSRYLASVCCSLHINQHTSRVKRVQVSLKMPLSDTYQEDASAESLRDAGEKEKERPGKSKGAASKSASPIIPSMW